jgi:hypothetical protein
MTSRIIIALFVARNIEKKKVGHISKATPIERLRIVASRNIC